MLIEHLESKVLNRDDLYFDEIMIENFIKFTEKWYFKLQPFQKFIVAFVFLYYKESNAIFYEQFFIMMARGAGKNGLISALTHFFISPLHGVPKYNVEIVANSELQAKTSFIEVYDCIQENEVLKSSFYPTRTQIMGKDTKSALQFHTSNAGTKDGLRSGCVIYDEIHHFENSDIPNVFSSGLGKVKNSREFFITTNGFLRDFYLDQMINRSLELLGEGEEKFEDGTDASNQDDPLFPFICKIDSADEIDDPSMWEKSNPMFSEPRSEYGQGLFRKVYSQYKQLSE